jgi:DNA-binding NtrC family response regulator
MAVPVSALMRNQRREKQRSYFNRGQFMAKSGLRILYGEGDAEVLKEQAAGMEKAGHAVQQAEGRKAVEAALKSGSFDLVVLGATLSRNDRHHLPYMVKKANEETRVLVTHADGTRHPYVDACTDTGSSLETMLARIESMKIAGAAHKTTAAGAGR